MNVKITKTLTLTQDQWDTIVTATTKYVGYDENHFKKLMDIANDDEQSTAKRNYAKKRAEYWSEIRDLLNALK